MANYQAMWLAELAQAPEGNDEAGGSGGWAASIKEVCVCGGGGGETVMPACTRQKSRVPLTLDYSHA